MRFAHQAIAPSFAASAAGARRTQVPTIQTAASASAPTRRRTIQTPRRRAGATTRTTAIWVAYASIEMATWTAEEIATASSQAVGGRRQTSAAATSTGKRNSAPIGSVTASARPRAATSAWRETGRANRNSFSGEPARTASLLAALAVRLPSANVPVTRASAAACSARPTARTIVENACANRST